ncbi:MAG TPA: hypothetical protein VFG35_31175 [Actinoplanes sp.]|nr:hypothetical protein [Actinoplanes sp.]
MSERTQAPRSGGRSAEPQRPANGRRDTGTSRDAGTSGGAGRGARRLADGVEDATPRRSDTRRSGTRNDEDRRRTTRDASQERGEARPARSRTRETKREAEDVRGNARGTSAARPKARDTDGVRAKARDTDGVRAKARGVDRKVPVGLGGRGRATAGRGKADAPIDGATALQIEVEPLRSTDGSTGPRLKVAPPPPLQGGPRAPFVASVIGLVIVGVLGILLINTKTNENSFRIDDLKKQNTALENQRQDLDQQVVEASSIGNLDAAARRLGLVKAKTEDVAQIRLPDGKIINFRKPSTGKLSPTARKGVYEPDLVSPDGIGR